MPNESVGSIQEYERVIARTMEAWTTQQRLAFVTALADRWLGAYEAFADAQEVGDPGRLRGIADALWDHLKGRSLPAAQRRRYRKQAQESAPDTEAFDDLDAWKALTACRILDHALEGSGSADNRAIAVKATLAAFDAVVSDWPTEPAMQAQVWQQPEVQDELTQQRALLDEIGSRTRIDAKAVNALRKRTSKSAQQPAGGLKAAARGGKQRKTPSGRGKRGGGDGLVGDLEGYRASMKASFAKRTPAHRVVFAAAMAERLLPLYEACAAATGRGRTEPMRLILEEIWRAAGSPPMDPLTRHGFEKELIAAEPQRQDPAARDAWYAWRVLILALACSDSAENIEPALAAALAAYHRAAGPGSENDPQAAALAWSRPEVQNEIQMQILMLLLFGMNPVIDAARAGRIRELYRAATGRSR